MPSDLLIGLGARVRVTSEKTPLGADYPPVPDETMFGWEGVVRDVTPKGLYRYGVYFEQIDDTIPFAEKDLELLS